MLRRLYKIKEEEINKIKAEPKTGNILNGRQSAFEVRVHTHNTAIINVYCLAWNPRRGAASMAHQAVQPCCTAAATSALIKMMRDENARALAGETDHHNNVMKILQLILLRT